jgi:hypothetical protein
MGQMTTKTIFQASTLHAASLLPRSASIAIAAVAMLIGGCVTSPQGVPTPKAAQKTTFSGATLFVWYFYAVEMDCSSGGLPTVWVTNTASHGSVEMRNVDHFTEYPSTNQRSECNKKKSPSVAVVYTANKDFVGVDKFTVKCVFPAGNVLIYNYQIVVEKPPSGSNTNVSSVGS